MSNETRPPEANSLMNVMGVNQPIEWDQAEYDRKLKETLARVAQVDRLAAEQREARTGANAPTAIENRKKIELYRLREDAKYAAIRLNEYGVPDVRLAQEHVDAALTARKAAGVAGALNEERRQERFLQQAEAELVAAQMRLEGFRKANTIAAAALKRFEEEIAVAESV
jgi:hypothetical protein